MLNTGERAVYLHEFKPPEGYVFDLAVGTTFTLDLITLLMAPLSITLLDAENRDEAFKDPMLLLEALRETAGRLSVFFHDGYISVPDHSSLLYSYLESMVVPVLPEERGGLFHPKVWVMRFISEDEPVLYRFLCLSRNLTFDRSWDTVLKLEGLLTSRKNGYARNRPLADFISMLGRIPVRELNDQAAGHLDTVLKEIRMVDFTPPLSFANEIRFYPSGFEGHRNQPDIKAFDRCLMISPFLSETIAEKLAGTGRDNILISRAESLDTLSGSVIDRLKERTEIYVMNEAAEISDEGLEETAGSDDSFPFRGLHAKMFITESGWDAQVRTGSANATWPAFTGGNIEFVTELTGKKSAVGIDTFLGGEDDRYSFMSLLMPYKGIEEPNGKTDTEKRIDAVLEQCRREIIKARFSGAAEENDDDSFSVILKPEHDIKIKKHAVITCRPVTLHPEGSRPLKPRREGAVFGSVSVQSLTTFFVFRISAAIGKQEAALSFVTSVPVNGIPEEERNRQVLLSIIGNKSRFFRYLLLILSENTNEMFLNSFIKSVEYRDKPADEAAGGFSPGLPLLEELVKAFSRSPEKIQRIDSLVKDIGSTEEGEKLIPAEFREIWNVFTEASAEGEHR